MLRLPPNTKDLSAHVRRPGVQYMPGGEPFFYNVGSERGVLLLHGFSATTHQFQNLAQYLLDQGITVCAPLVAGHGTVPRHLVKARAKDWRQSTVDALRELSKVCSKVYIVGNSFGGNLGFDLAYRYPRNVAGVVSMGTPVRFRYQTLIKIRLYTYGLLQRNYRKKVANYATDYTDLSDEVTYPVIPIVALRRMMRFVKRQTKKQLPQLTMPALIMAADHDEVVSPTSAQYIHEHLGSRDKKIYWIHTNTHTMALNHEVRDEIMKRISDFVTNGTPSL